ncbi:type II toxin-antitoxin system VapC family toxin [Pararhodonellum marinum]|uniref:type II toxin-antitoxin system VapC family toxin n=1 Tax=Pararhodonellum marinum TaxID=2755358 RepID=UPI00188F26C7|nr:putative toxin-antitoxin system toxin component, PIN family [Pararhodonellum marinum]
MVNVVIDTSVWIAFFLGKDRKIIGAVKELLDKDQVLICPPVYQEILQGIPYPNEFLKMKDRLSALRQINADPFEAAEGAAQIYSVLRTKGVTIRKSYDCLIAWYAISSDAALFHLDKDFIPIAEFFKLRFYSIMKK